MLIEYVDSGNLAGLEGSRFDIDPIDHPKSTSLTRTGTLSLFLSVRVIKAYRSNTQPGVNIITRRSSIVAVA
jgi:hypothetical protein